uniref:Cyclic nucleotide-binding domain-containing protein n=2 Tax=Paramoeba aestuarina TaxID=180227 RepID=A0A7S4P9P0_9EUKA
MTIVKGESLGGKVVYSCEGVVLGAEGSSQIRGGNVFLTETSLVVEEKYFDLTVKTTIPLEAVKSIRKRQSMVNTARIAIYKQIANSDGTIWEKRRRNFVFRDKRVLKLFVSAVRKSKNMEDEDAEEEIVGDVGAVEVTRHIDTIITAKAMSLEDHIILEENVEFLRFLAGEVIIPFGMACEGIYQIDFGAVNVTDGGGQLVKVKKEGGERRTAEEREPAPFNRGVSFGGSVIHRSGILKPEVFSQIPTGSTFGELQFVTGSTMGETSLVADDEVVVKFWSKKVIDTLLETNNSFAAGFLGTISKRVRSRLIYITNKASQEAAEHPSPQEQDKSSSSSSKDVSQKDGLDSLISDRSLSNDKVFKCKMKKMDKATQRGTLTVGRTGLMFHFRVFGLKTKIRTTYLELNTGEATVKMADLKGKPAIELTKSGETTLYFGDSKKIKRAYEAINEGRDALASSTLGGSEDESLELNMEQRQETLRPDDWAKILELATRKKYEQGQAVIKEGEAANSVFQIVNGSVGIQKKGGYRTNLQEGAVFGEMSFLYWFTEGKDAFASADVVANGKVEMVCLEGRALSALLLSDDGLCYRFFRYIVSLMSTRIEMTLPMEGDWMKAWCPEGEIQTVSKIKKLNLYRWLKEDMKFPDDIVDLYRDRLKNADFTTLQSLSIATDAELASAGISVIHRRKMIWWVSRSENLIGEKREGGMFLVTWMRKQMMWPEDVIENYSKLFGEEVTTVMDLKKLGVQDLAQMGIAPIHQRKISFWMATNH